MFFVKLRQSMDARPTSYALGAIVLWSTQAVVLAETLPKLNILLFLTLAYFCSAFLLWFRVRERITLFHQKNSNNIISSGLKRIWAYIRRPYIIWATGTYFLYHLFLFYAIKKGPVISANLLNYLWPLLFLLMVKCLPIIFPKEKKGFWETSLLTVKLLMGFLGALLILTKGNLSDFKILTIFQTQQGPLIGLLAAVMWAIFSILLKSNEAKLTEDQVKLSWVIYPFMAAIVSFLMWFNSPTYLLPSLHDYAITFLLAVYFGIGPLGFAMIWYDKAIHAIDAKQLSQLIFLTPLLSTLLLIIFSKTITLSPAMFLGGGLIIIVNMRIIETIKSIFKLMKRGNSKILNSRTV